MDSHKNARLTMRKSRAVGAQGDRTGCDAEAGRGQLQRHREDSGQVGQALSGAGSGWAGRSQLAPAPALPAHLQPTVERVEALRRQRWTGHRIARQTGLSRSTVSRILRRLKLNRIRDLEPAPPIQRYEHAAPGDLLHLDIKKLGRIAQPSHRVTGNRRDTVKRHRLGVCPRRHRRSLAHRILRHLSGSEALFGRRLRCMPPSPGTPASASASRPCSPTTGPPIARSSSPRPAERSASSIASPAPTPRAPTARPNASSRPPCENGPTPAPTHNSDQRFQQLHSWLHRLQLAPPPRQPQPSTPISRAALDRNNLLSLHI